MAKSYLLAGGGTAGHVNPLLATASALQERGHQVAALGTAEGLEQDLVPRAGIALHEVPKVPLPRRPSAELFKLPSRLKAAVNAARAAIESTQADAVVGFGGYVSTPAYLAARKVGVPVVVHEANARPGLANRLGARRTEHVAVTFPGTPLPHATVTGLPLRPELRDLAALLRDPRAAKDERESARAMAGWAPNAPVLLITGGSLGAASINAAAVEAVPRLLDHGVHVWHLTGRGKAEDAWRVHGQLKASQRGQYRVEEYCHDMAAAFAAASAVACRSGAATVSEITALGLPALYIPLPHGNGEQALNASSAVDAGAAQLIDDAALTPAALEQAAEKMILDPDAAASMRDAAFDLGIVDGAERLVAMIEAAS